MIDHWMFRCKDITELISQSMDKKPSLHIRLGIKFHLMMCRLCTRYRDQLYLTRKALVRINGEDAPDPPARKLPDQAREKIKKIIG